ncbi:MAG: sensor domain-containing diguanylate cyclase [Burkholderiales bacterium]
MGQQIDNDILDERREHLEQLYPIAETVGSRITRVRQLAARLFKAQAVLVPVPGRAPAWAVAAGGFATCEEQHCFISHTLSRNAPFLVPDVAADARFAANPNVAAAPGLGFFAGCPLHDSLGHRAGVFALFGPQPRELSADELLTLRDLVRWAEAELRISSMGEAQIELIEELNLTQRAALLHPGTRTWNRHAIENILAKEIDRSRRAKEPLSLAIAELDYMDFIRQTYGAASADAVIQQAAVRVLGVVRPYDSVGYLGDGRFLIVLPGCRPDAAYTATEKLRSVLAAKPCDTIHGAMRTSMSVGVAACDYEERDLSPEMLLQATEIALQSAQDQGRNQVITN